MDPFVLILLAVVAVFLVLRLRNSFRRGGKTIDKTQEFEQKLAQLRKKRDED
ncbi:hypothetical protein [Paenibacillus roseipurpureus]|uniref:Uncharacterized protein n=1 Tax=Paenibacillus roseopurpureus TaxID=2918901 RepID=A0AA96LQS6_9BACL|nr:hypothetical protein [Paenibacillus sp. MBLB1832]WNR45616.1 hypothetical protein MJB10_05795 [Paenibacillus sp. MBLB1832]